jgi:hypothetical protein
MDVEGSRHRDWSLAIVFVPSITAECQEQPTKARCRTVAAWIDEDTSTLTELSAVELNRRSKEALACSLSTPGVPNIFDVLAARYEVLLDNRESDFIVRHNMFELFMAEDLAGKRGRN